MPADVVSRPRVEVQRIGMGVIRRRGLKPLARELAEPLDQCARSIQLRDERCVRIDGMTADAAALLVARQIVAMDQRLDGGRGGDQPLRDRLRQKVGYVQEGALPRILLPQSRRLASSANRGSSPDAPAAASPSMG